MYKETGLTGCWVRVSIQSRWNKVEPAKTKFCCCSLLLVYINISLSGGWWCVVNSPTVPGLSECRVLYYGSVCTVLGLDGQKKKGTKQPVFVVPFNVFIHRFLQSLIGHSWHSLVEYRHGFPLPSRVICRIDRQIPSTRLFHLTYIRAQTNLQLSSQPHKLHLSLSRFSPSSIYIYTQRDWESRQGVLNSTLQILIRTLFNVRWLGLCVLHFIQFSSSDHVPVFSQKSLLSHFLFYCLQS